MQKINPDMPIYVRATVNETEKEAVKLRQDELDLNEGELIRAGLQKMGVEIEIKKAVGVSTGNFHGTRGSHPNHKKVEHDRAEIRADYEAGMSWKQLRGKYGFSLRTLNKVLADLIAAKKSKP